MAMAYMIVSQALPSVRPKDETRTSPVSGRLQDRLTIPLNYPVVRMSTQRFAKLASDRLKLQALAQYGTH